MNPKDPQSVPRATKLLRALHACAMSHEELQHGDVDATRRAVSLLGLLCGSILLPFLDIDMHLKDQLISLSLYAHLALTLYRMGSTNFIPGQLYHDSQAMVKNVYFCVAKQQIVDRTGTFCLLRVGTDSLEGLFGEIRTLIGSDRNVDIGRLADRASAAADVAMILDRHPEWKRGSRRQSTTDSRADDHIRERSWKGDLSVDGVSLSACWLAGRHAAEKILRSHRLEQDFLVCSEAGLDIMRPMKTDQYPGTSSTERDRSIDESLDLPSSLPASAEDTRSLADSRPQIVPAETDREPGGDNDLEAEIENDESLDIEDLLCDDGQPDIAPEGSGRIVWIDVQGSLQHVSTVVKTVCNGKLDAKSIERLRRVRGYSKPSSTSVTFSEVDNEDRETVIVGSHAATLLRIGSAKNAKLAIALLQIIRFLPHNKLDKKRYLSVTTDDLSKYELAVQLLRLSSPTLAQCETSSEFFEWSGEFDVPDGQISRQTASFKVDGALCVPVTGDSAPSVMQSGPQDDPSRRIILRYPLEDLRLLGDEIFANLGGSQCTKFRELKWESGHVPYCSVNSQ